MSANYPSDLWQKLKDREYRQGYIEAQTFIEVSLQVSALRKARGWSLAKLSRKSGIPKERLEEIEEPGFEFTLEDLHGLAAAFDVGLLTQFVAFSELVYRASSFNPEDFEVPSFEKDEPGFWVGISTEGSTSQHAPSELDFAGAVDVASGTIRTGSDPVLIFRNPTDRDTLSWLLHKGEMPDERELVQR